MGNIFETCKGSKTKIYNNTLFEPLNTTDPYSSINLYNNLDFVELNDYISKLKTRIDNCEHNIISIEHNSQENFKLLSKDIHHINNKLHIEPPTVI
jgi:hypothetical protein